MRLFPDEFTGTFPQKTLDGRFQETNPLAERIERISIVHYDIEQRTAVLSQLLLILNSTSQHFHQLAEFIELLAGYALIDGITLKQVLLQYLIGPNAESGCIF